MIDPKFIGHALTPHQALIEAGRLRFFAKATGQTDPIYADEAAAQAAGYPALPAPPTFLFCLNMETADPYEWVRLLDIDLGKVLHGEQGFTYRRVVCAGETLRFAGVIKNIYAKKGGALSFVETETEVTDATDAPVATLRGLTVVRA
ncbi:MAG: MaoC family dehydratase N-terminal domain-containing protein [Pseudomonadota bacterium]